MNQPWALSTALYFDSIRSTMWRAEALRIGQSIAAKLGLAITHVDVSGSTKSVHGISTERYLQWGGSSLRRFEQAIHKGPPLTGFGLFWCPDGEDPEVSAFCFTIDYSDDEAKSPRGRAYFHISGDRLAPWMDSLNERLYMVLKDWDALASIKYGYVQPIAIHKVPPLFAYGLRGGDGNTRLELTDNSVWLIFRDLYALKARSLFWGNVVTRQHLIPDFREAVSQIQSIVGNGNTFQLPDERVLFMLPLPVEDAEDREASPEYGQLRLSLQRIIRFMEPDEWALKETVPFTPKSAAPVVSDIDGECYAQIPVPNSLASTADLVVLDMEVPGSIKDHASDPDPELKALLLKSYGEHTVIAGIKCPCGSLALIVQSPCCSDVPIHGGPLAALCASCGQRISLFDPDTEGYGSVVGEAHAYGTTAVDAHEWQRVQCAECGHHEMAVANCYQHSLDDEDMEELQDLGVELRDAFQWFACAGKCRRCGCVGELYSYECA